MANSYRRFLSRKPHGPAGSSKPTSGSFIGPDRKRGHFSAVGSQPFEQEDKIVRVRARGAVLAAHMAMGDVGPGSERLMAAFDLLVQGDWNGGIVRFLLQEPGDCDADDAGRGHAAGSHWLRVTGCPVSIECAAASANLSARRPSRASGVGLLPSANQPRKAFISVT